MTFVTEVMQSWCPHCEEYTFEARRNFSTGEVECPDCGGEVQ